MSDRGRSMFAAVTQKRRPRRGAAAVIGASLGAALAMACAITPAFAQAAAECAAIGPMLQERGKLLQRAQGFSKKKPTAAEACSVFTSLANNGAKIMPWLKTNSEWCHVPPEVATNVGAQGAQVAKAKANACQAAVMQKKMEAQARQGGGQKQPGLFGGGDDIVGGPIKMPQGAL
jgi:alpha-beta hydrolase superfamily lysophospholipase